MLLYVPLLGLGLCTFVQANLTVYVTSMALRPSWSRSLEGWNRLFNL